jgi:hypothetical protein
VEVNGCVKHSSLLRYGNNYNSKTFYSTGPWKDCPHKFEILTKFCDLVNFLNPLFHQPAPPAYNAYQPRIYRIAVSINLTSIKNQFAIYKRRTISVIQDLHEQEIIKFTLKCQAE